MVAVQFVDFFRVGPGSWLAVHADALPAGGRGR